jgi:hypothetical protein
VFSDWTADDILITLSQAPLTTFLMMNAFLALLPGIATDLLRSADVDLSDEIFSHAEKAAHGDAFGVRVLERAGQGLRLLVGERLRGVGRGHGPYFDGGGGLLAASAAAPEGTCENRRFGVPRKSDACGDPCC